MPATRSRSPNANGPRRARRRHLRGTNDWDHRPAGHRDPLVREQVLPAHEGQPAAGHECPRQIGERRNRIGEEHHAEAAHDDVELRIEAVLLRIGLHELDVGETVGGGVLTSPLQHGRRDVDADDRGDARGDRSTGGAAATAHVEHAVGGLELGGIENAIDERRQHGVELRFVIDPVLALGPVPVLDLVGVAHPTTFPLIEALGKRNPSKEPRPKRPGFENAAPNPVGRAGFEPA